MRILDSFGTDAQFNYPYYKENIPGGRSPWGDLHLRLPQFMTMFRKSQLKDVSTYIFSALFSIFLIVQLKRICSNIKTLDHFGLVHTIERSDGNSIGI